MHFMHERVLFFIVLNDGTKESELKEEEVCVIISDTPVRNSCNAAQSFKS